MRGFYFSEDNDGNVYLEMGDQEDRIRGFILTNIRVYQQNIPMQAFKGCHMKDFLFEDNSEAVLRSQIMTDIFSSSSENIKEVRIEQVLYSAKSARVGNVEVKFIWPESRKALGTVLPVNLK